AEVVGGDGLALQVPGRLERRLRLGEQPPPRALIELVVRAHVQRVAEAVLIAARAAQVRSLGGSGIGVGDPALLSPRHGDYPERTSLAGAIPQPGVQLA